MVEVTGMVGHPHMQTEDRRTGHALELVPARVERGEALVGVVEWGYIRMRVDVELVEAMALPMEMKEAW
jgi:hypothetical protein